MIPGNANPLLLASVADGAAAAAGPIKSLRFNAPDSAYLSKTPGGGNRKKFTMSFWYKPALQDTSNRRVILEARNASGHHSVINLRDSDDKLEIYHYDGSLQFQVLTSARFRDPSAWYSFVIAYNTEASGSDKIKIFVNGARITAFDTSNYPSDNYEALWNDNNVPHTIGKHDTNKYLSGYLADIYFIDGSQLDATSFGAYDDNGVWQAAEYSGTYGTNGYHLLDFENESTIGHDSSGNENDWTANNFSTTAGTGNDVLFDVPTNGTQSDTGAGGEVSGNYCTLNPLDINSQASLSNGNLDWSTTNGNGTCRGTIAVSSGKWYFEFTYNQKPSGGGAGFGVLEVSESRGFPGSTNFPDGYTYYSEGSSFTKKYGQGSNSNYGASYAPGDVIGVALDLDGGTITFYKNGASQGQAFSSISGTYAPSVASGTSVGTAKASFNAGQRAFAYSAPSGYKALCTTNLPTPTIADGSDHFDVLTWTGDGSGSRSFTGLSFQPDFTWVKIRSQAYTHTLFDSVRGAGSNKELSTDVRKLEGYANTAASGYLSSFDTNGFSSTEGTSDNDYFNKTGNTYVAWNWKGASSTASNTDGTITTSIRANQTAGFSIVSFEGTGASGSIGHGLNTAPELVVVKDRESETGWPVWGPGFAANEWMALNNTNDKSTTDGSNYFPSAPTSSVVNLGPWTSPNGKDMIVYCFTSVKNYSQIGLYEGNGSTDGTFVFTGFRPRWIMIKSIDSDASTRNWNIHDTARNPENDGNTAKLYPNLNNAELDDSEGQLDILSNGFKLRGNWLINNVAETYLYMAIAENPFQANGGLAR